MVDAPPSPSLVSAFIGVLLAPVVTLLTAWAIGHRLAARWSLWQKHREQTLAATSEFYRLYGEFFAVWKLWNNSVRQSTAVGQDDRRWNLLERAAAAEASMETIMLKLASERILSEADLATLGRFRQAFQYLRDVIRQREELDWHYSEHPGYLAFKKLAVRVSRLVSADVSRLPTAEQAQELLIAITSNRWEGVWSVHRDEHIAATPRDRRECW